jgi:hypothetical protein
MARPPLSNEQDEQDRPINRGAAVGEHTARIRGLALLRDLIDQHFSLDEIQTLSFDLGIEFEHLAGNTRPLKIQNLIIYLSQRERLSELLAQVQDQRPSVPWQRLALNARSDWTAEEAEAPGPAPHSPRLAARSQYLDFEIEVGQGAGLDYPIAIIQSPAGPARETMRFPYDELALENRLQSLKIALLHAAGGQRQVLTDEERLVQDFGRDLFNALFSGEARKRFDASCAEARQQGKGLRLKLRLNPPELARLPWEFLYDPRRAEYVCLSRETPIIRYLELPQLIQPLAVSPPLRILGMTVSPEDLASLDIPREKRRVEKALGPLQVKGAVQLTWLAGTTWRDLHRAMRDGPWHIFHFIGHGGFDRRADEGFIALAGEDGQAQPLLATELGRLLADHFPLRLVLLNSCEGAMGSEHDIFSSTAAILVRRGLPAVLAMQYGITDRGAIEFSRAFYEALSDSLPVDAAVAEARKAVSLAKTYTVEWGTPVLYMRAPQGVIFNIAESTPSPLPTIPETDSELEQRLEQLFTDGLSAFWIKDWDKASRCFQSILEVRPGHTGAADRLAEAKRQGMLAALYAQSEAAGENWPAAIDALEQLVEMEPDYRDAQRKLAYARQQRHLADLSAEASRLAGASQWLAVVNVYAQIHAIDPAYPDPDGLLAKAEAEVAESRRLQELDNRYGLAVRELDAGHLAEAVELLAAITAEEPGYREADQLLQRARQEIARRESEQQRQEQIEALYEQAAGLAQAGQWEQVLAKMEEINGLEPAFADPNELVTRARQEIASAEAEAQRQTELAAMYAEAVKLLKAEEYQAALDKWSEVLALDPHYHDRHKVRRTAKKKLRQLSQGDAARRWPERKTLWIAGGVVVIAAVAALILLNNSGPTGPFAGLISRIRCGEGVVYCEDFESGQAQGWSLGTGWSVVEAGDNHFLQGTRDAEAKLNLEGWQDYRLRLRIRMQHWQAHVNYRFRPDNNSYLIRLDGDQLGLARTKDGQHTGDLALSVPGRSYFYNHWYEMEIVGDGNHIQVYLDGIRELDFTDDNPVLEGGISFGLSPDSAVQIDDIEVVLID